MHLGPPRPLPSSEPANTLFARETWIDGSAEELVPQPDAPIVWSCSVP